jgi:hypothetical protein
MIVLAMTNGTMVLLVVVCLPVLDLSGVEMRS